MPTLQTTPINASNIGDNTVIIGISGQVIQVVALYFQCNTSTTLTIKSNSSSFTGPMNFLAGGGLNLPINGNVYYQTQSGDNLIFSFSGATGRAGGQIMYYQF